MKILLACGIGASSGFIAAKMRKYAKSANMDVSVKAVSKSEIGDYEGDFDMLLLGPHFSSELSKYKDLYQTENIKVMTINPDYYATLNGEAVMKEALEVYNS